jgi:hypothetical protein
MKRCLPIALLIAACQFAHAQDVVLDAGPRFQKAIGLYYENGISVSYSAKKLLNDKLYLGFSYYTSRLGTAINSNAIKQDNYLVSAGWYYRRAHIIRPFIRVSAGYFSADYGSPIFDVLPRKSLLLSPDVGICFQTHLPLKISTSFGYHAIYSNGLNNVPGTIYPFYYQLTASWNILNHKK